MTVRLHTLPNGFRIATERMPGLASAAIGVWVLGRHAATSGPSRTASPTSSSTWPSRAPRGARALEIAEAIEDVGGYINAYTSREMTAYYARVLEDDVPLALDVHRRHPPEPRSSPTRRSRSSAA